MKIRIAQGCEQFFAYIEGAGSGAHGCTPDDALGALVRENMSRLGVFGIDIQYALPLDFYTAERTLE